MFKQEWESPDDVIDGGVVCYNGLPVGGSAAAIFCSDLVLHHPLNVIMILSTFAWMFCIWMIIVKL